MDYISILLYLSPLALLLYLYINKVYSYWSNQGIGGPPNIFPFGYLFARVTQQPIDFELDYKKKYGDFYGVYNGVMPTLTISDPELVKNVLIKDFHLFVNRRKFKVLDPYWKHNLFLNHDDAWKRIRSITTPAFTTGKLRRMYPLLKQATDKLENYFSSVVKNGKTSVDIKKIIAGYTIDVIASTSFGTDTDTNGDRSKFNPFLHHGSNFFMNVSMTRFLAILTLPVAILRALKIHHPFATDSFNFFVNVVKTMIKRSGKRDDLITLMKEANISDDELQDGNFSKLTASSDLETPGENDHQQSIPSKAGKTLSDEEIVAQCILFFVAGFETTGSAITNTLYNLSKNQDIQDRLYEEVRDKLGNIDPNDLTEYYETIVRLPYLEAVLKETLRLYPPVARLERRLNGDSYQLGKAHLERDQLVEISTVALHYNPEYYPNPEKYDPTRFLPENKHKIVPYTYIPFGDGPRNCVGMRFAYQEAKICLASLILKFRFETNEKTPMKLQFPKRNGVLIPLPFQISVDSR